MRWLVPKSLIGQIALVMAAALLAAQAINFSLIFTERIRVSRAQIEGPAINRFILFAQRLESARESERAILLSAPRRSRYTIDRSSIVAPAANDAALVERLRDSAAANGLTLRDARAMSAEAMPVARRLELVDVSPRLKRNPDEWRLMALSVRLRDGFWVNAWIVTPRPNPWLALRPLIATLLTYLITLAAMIWVAARIVRPLRDLTSAAESLQGRGEAPQVEPRGPEDLSRAILAFNAMSARVSAMLDEKDRMLGAIGHDLRTPLASLRIRAESVEPADERQRMIATIEEMAEMLEDSLALARSGRAVEEPRPVDLAALADAVVEEFRALGQDVTMAEGGRHNARVQPNLIRRAIRNLIENAVEYGHRARVLVRDADGQIAIEVSDDGPGIAPDEIARVLEPFYRVEPSRSRETGGAGLGLTLARAAATANGGRLELENRSEGGLTARILVAKDATLGPLS